MFGFSSIIAATWFMVSNYLVSDNVEKYPGIGLFLQNVLIFTR